MFPIPFTSIQLQHYLNIYNWKKGFKEKLLKANQIPIVYQINV